MHLAIIAKAIRAKVKEINSLPIPTNNEKNQLIKFVKAGSKPNKSWTRPQQSVLGLLSHARDWEVNFDLPEDRADGSVFVFPYDVCATPLRVDAYIISRSTKTCIAGPELTAPMEENIEHWHKVKQDKYRTEFCDAIGRFQPLSWKLVAVVGSLHRFLVVYVS